MGGKRKFQQQLTPLELQIMNVLWDCGPCNVQSVHAQRSSS
jgi:predicted transcriptional regulator